MGFSLTTMIPSLLLSVTMVTQPVSSTQMRSNLNMYSSSEEKVVFIEENIKQPSKKTALQVKDFFLC